MNRIFRLNKIKNISVERKFSLDYDSDEFRQLICCFLFVIGTRSIIYVVFSLRRHVGYFLLQLYIPCILIVFLSWVGLWLNREATNDRINLGISVLKSIFACSSMII